MADRLLQYQTMPSNFNPGLIQQQQLSQPQQQPQVDPQSTPAFPNDQQQLWHPFVQNQYRSQPGGDMKGPQLSQQMTELMRSQQRPQGQQQMTHLAQSSSFHDQTPQHPQAHMPQNFQTIPMNNSLQVPQMLNPRMLPFNNPPQMPQQLEMRPSAPNQQQPNRPVNYNHIPQQHQPNLNNRPNQIQTPQSDIFSSLPNTTADNIRRSPSHPSQPPTSIGNHLPVTQQNTRPPMTFQSLQERAMQLRTAIENDKGQIAQVTKHRGIISESDFQTRMHKHASELALHQGMLSRVIQASQSILSGNAPSGGHVGNINAMNGQSQSQQPVQLGPNQQQPWMQPSQSQPPNFPTAQIGQGRPSNIQPSPLQQHAQPNHPQQNLLPARTAPAQQQLPQAMGQISQTPAQLSFRPGAIPPLDKGRFDSAYQSYCETQNVRPDARMMSVENRSIDLHSLHTHVIHEGGVGRVNQNELWAFIGARMGFSHFPATESEPAKSASGVAQRLAHVYKEYLAAFDFFYVKTVLDSKRKMQATAQGQRGVTGGVVSNPQQMLTLLKYAHVPAADLRSQGVTEQVVMLVETHRAQLQELRKMQPWRGNLVNSSTPSVDQDRVPPPTGQFQPGSQPLRFPPTSGSNQVDPHFTRPPQISSTNGTGPPNFNKEQVQQYITRMKQTFLRHNIPKMLSQPHNLLDEQRIDYNKGFDLLERSATDIDQRLPVYLSLLKQEETSKLIAIIVSVRYQRHLLGSPTPKFIISFQMIMNMIHQLQQAREIGATLYSTMMKQNQAPADPSLGPPRPNNSPTRPQAPPTRPPATPPQPFLMQPNRPVSQMPPPAGRKRPSPVQTPSSSTSIPTAPIQANHVMVSTPTPPPPQPPLLPAHTPSGATSVASAATPTPAASSPQETKSPKTKAAIKPKSTQPAKRKASKNNPTAQATPPSGVGLKRPRDEDRQPTPSESGTASGSSPKRIKTEWEGAPDEALVKKQTAVGAVPTEAEANNEWLEQLLKLAAQDSSQEPQPDVWENITTILNECAVPDAAESSSRSLESNGRRDSPSLSLPAVDEFIEYIDFSSFGTLDDDENGSKAHTPDLVSASSTNPSPESGSEIDAVGQGATTDWKLGDIPDLSDPLRLGPWKEIDGGESAYYQHSDWKWDSPMPTLEQPWAVFPT